MTGRALLGALFACSCAFAQLQVRDMRSGSFFDPTLTIDFGTTPVGVSISSAFQVVNTSSSLVQLDILKVEGVSYTMTRGTSLPVSLASQASLDFTVTLTPVSQGTYGATLYVNSDAYSIVATATSGGGGSTSPLPPFSIVVVPQALASGQQAHLSLQFASKASTQGNGLLKMDFMGKGDPAIRFISPASRSVPFTVSPGEDFARFSDQSGIDFQTGTTAGSIKFTATLYSETEERSFDLAPTAVSLDSFRVSQSTGTLTLSVPGYDNTRTLSGATFTFFDSASRALAGGPMRVDVGPAFASYFQHPALGGQFVLRAAFPVSGDVSAIDSVKVELTNAAGTSWGSVKITE